MATKKWLCPKCENNKHTGVSKKECPSCNTCDACDGSGFLHNDIINSITKFGNRHGFEVEIILIDLRYDGMNKCFCFERNGMYHGVEYLLLNRGHIHT